MGEIEDLERSLQQSWDFDVLSLYGDALQQAGDPRGELIAFDLNRRNKQDLRNVAGPREGAMRRWLGKTWADDRRIVSTTYGMIGLSVWASSTVDALGDLLAAPFAPYLHSLRLLGTVDQLAQLLDTACSATRPWLNQLSLRRHEDSQFGSQRRRQAGLPVTLEGMAFPRIAAAPNLRWLDIRGTAPVVRELVHPNVRMLSITGMANLRALAQRVWPEVEVLSFAFGYESKLDCSLDELAALIVTAFPKLTSLDLSRNEPTPAGATYEVGARHHAGPLRVVELVERWPSELTRLSLPSLRSEADVARVQAVLDRMPALTSLDVVRRYRSCAPCELSHPTAAITIAPVSTWPPEDELQPRLELEVDVPGEARRIRLQPMLALMEVGYRELEKGERDAWDRLWALLEELQFTDGQIEAAVLHRALDIVDLLQELVELHALSIQDSELQHLLSALTPIAKSKQLLTVRTAIAE